MNTPSTTPPGRAIDIHIGLRLRMRRVILGLGQQHLGTAIGVSFQQIQKYECGQNRLSAARLFDLSTALDVPISYFFQGFAAGAPAPGPARPPPHERDAGAQAESRCLVEAYWDMPDAEFRRCVRELVHVLGPVR